MTSPHGRRLQTRRALAILTWGTLTVCAWLLWYGQRKDLIRIQAWEPAALVLSAYATFLSIFGWMLFSPGNRSAEESPGLFFSGMLTLIPPCFIAYNLMPDTSPLRPWLTIGVFLFGVLAIMSPLPKEVFAVPRDRRSYLQPLTDAYLSELNTEPPELRFDNLLPKTRFWLTQPDDETRQRETARDPWVDPFYGTGRQLSRVGVSQSRRHESTTSELPAFRGVGYSPERGNRLDATGSDAMHPDDTETRLDHDDDGSPRGSSITMPHTTGRRPLTEPGQPKNASSAVPIIVPPLPVSGVTAFTPPTSGSDPFAPTSHSDDPTGRATLRHMTPPPLPRNSSIESPISKPAPPINAAPMSAAPSLMGFQSPGRTANTPVTAPLPGPASVPATRPTPTHGPAVAGQRPAERTPPSVNPLSTDTIATLASGMLGGHAATTTAVNTVSVPVVATLTETARPLTDSIESNAAEVRSIMESIPRTVSSTPPQAIVDFNRTAALRTPVPAAPVAERTSPSLQELDRQLRELEAEEEAELQQSTAAQTLPPSGRSAQSNDNITMERIADEHGGEMIEGTVKVFFEVGQKRAHLHVPFTPPLGGIPEVECEPAHDDGIRVKVAVRQPYGIRLEVRRTDAAESLRSEISFAAVCTKK